ncbi:MAG TPA: hypothetical protein VES39_01230, partial [Rhodospirillales bacterium]|nr:hypothetical protein [Rhodospirillales bacterium]
VSRPNGRITVDGTSDLGPLTASADFAVDEGRWLNIERLMARAFGAALDGDVQADLAVPLARGTLRLATQSPQAGIRFGDAALQGPLALDLRLTPQGSRQTAMVALRGGPLSLQQGGQQQLGIAGLRGDATVTDAFTEPQISAVVQARQLTGPANVEQLRLTADGTPARARLTLAGEGGGDSPATIDAAADVAQVDDALRIDLERLQGRLGGETLGLSRPARLVSAPGRLELEGFVLAVGGGSLAADARLVPGETVATLRAQALPIRLARAFAAAAPEHGTLQADLSLRSERTETVGTGRIGLRGVGFDDARSADARFDTDLDLRLGNGALQVDGSVAGPEGSRLTLRALVPVRLPSGRTAPVLYRAAPIDGSLGVDANLAKVARLLALHDQRIEGRITGALEVSGTFADPVVQGGIDLTDGLYENFVSATLLSGLTARLEPRERRSLALRLTGNDGGQGRIFADGEATLQPTGGVQARVKVRAEDATLVRRDDVTATIDADIAYIGDDGPPRLAGRIQSREILVRLIERLPPSVVQLPVTEIGRPRALRPQPEDVAAAAA